MLLFFNLNKESGSFCYVGNGKRFMLALLFRVMNSQTSVASGSGGLTNSQRLNKGVKISQHVEDPKLAKKAGKLVWMFLGDNDMNPFTLTCNHSSWPEGVSLEDKMNMTQPTKLKFSTTGDGTFWASFVGKVKTTQSKQASAVVTKKRQKKMDEPAANVSSIRYVSWYMKFKKKSFMQKGVKLFELPKLTIL